MKKLYGVSPLMQRDEVGRYCFGECGKILVSGGFALIQLTRLGPVLDSDVTGPLFPCEHDDCPFEDGRTGSLWISKDIDGADIEVAVRKLKPLSPDEST